MRYIHTYAHRGALINDIILGDFERIKISINGGHKFGIIKEEDRTYWQWKKSFGMMSFMDAPLECIKEYMFDLARSTDLKPWSFNLDHSLLVIFRNLLTNLAHQTYEKWNNLWKILECCHNHGKIYGKFSNVSIFKEIIQNSIILLNSYP